MPAYTIDASVDEVVVNSLTKITFTVGPNSITIDPSGVTIKCVNLTLDADMQTQLQTLMFKESVSGVKNSSVSLYEQS